MNNIGFAKKALKRKPIHSAIQTERFKIVLQFALTVLCSFVIGLLLIRILPEQFYSASILKVSTHFETVFINCEIPYDYIRCILKYSLPDIICIITLFGVSFFTFNYVATNLVLIYNGARSGGVSAFLWAFISSATLSYGIGVLRYTVFVVFKMLLLALIFDYSCRSALYSHKLKEVSDAGRPNVKARVLLPFILHLLTYLGSAIILNGIYCFLIYALK